MNRSLFLLAALTFSSAAHSCKDLGELLAHDEPRVKQVLLDQKPGQRLAGIVLCTNDRILKGWRYLRLAKSQAPYQHILLFKTNEGTQAVVWIEPKGEALPVPPCPYGKRCTELPEAATVISGDTYTFNKVMPGDNLVILAYPPSTW